MSDQREQLNEMKQFMSIAEGKERPYVCHHAKKGEHSCTADSSYGAAKKAAAAWGLDSTAGVSATLTDVKQSTQFVGEDGMSMEADPEGVWFDKDYDVGQERRSMPKRYVITQQDWDKWAIQKTNKAGKPMSKPQYTDRAGIERFVIGMEKVDEPMMGEGGEFIDDKLRSGEIDTDDVDFGPECNYCDDEEPLDSPCLNCGSKQFVGEDEGHSIRDILNSEELAALLGDLDKEGDIVYGASYFDKLYFHFLDTHPDEIPVGSRTGRPDDVDGYVLDNLENDYGDEVRSMIDRELDNRKNSLSEGDPDDTDWDAHWAREDGDDERADDLEADAEFARMDDELDEGANDNWGVGDFVVTVWDEAGRHSEPLKVTGVNGDQVRVVDEHGNTALMFPEDLRLAPNEVSETGWGNMVRTDPDDEDEEPHVIKDRHAERPHTSGYNKLGSGARAAADSRAQAFMVDEDDDADGMGSYDIIWGDDTWKEAIPYDAAEREVQRILNIIDDSALQAHDNNDHLQTKKTAEGDTMIWTVHDPIDGDHQVIRVEPSDLPAGYTGESIELDNIVESVLEEYPGQPKDYDASNDETETEDEFENDRIDPEYEDSELGLRFD